MTAAQAGIAPCARTRRRRERARKRKEAVLEAHWARVLSGTPTPAVDIVDKMSKEEFNDYRLEGGLPIAASSVADEDYDPTPVPIGCPGCYKRDGSWVCENCPAKQQANARRREMIRQGLVSPVC